MCPDSSSITASAPGGHPPGRAQTWGRPGSERAYPRCSRRRRYSPGGCARAPRPSAQTGVSGRQLAAACTRRCSTPRPGPGTLRALAEAWPSMLLSTQNMRAVRQPQKGLGRRGRLQPSVPSRAACFCHTRSQRQGCSTPQPCSAQPELMVEVAHLSTSRKGMRTTPSQSARLPSRSTLNSPGKKSRMGDAGSVISSCTGCWALGRGTHGCVVGQAASDTDLRPGGCSLQRLRAARGLDCGHCVSWHKSQSLRAEQIVSIKSHTAVIHNIPKGTAT